VSPARIGHLENCRAVVELKFVEVNLTEPIKRIT
jgi:hypothetical protein